MERRKIVIASAIAGFVVVGGGVAFATAAQLFTSPKQILINSIEHSSARTKSAVSGEATFDMTLRHLSIPNSSLNPVSASFLRQFDGSSLTGTARLDEGNQESEVDMKLGDSSHTYTGQLWVTNDQAIVDVSSLQSLLASFAQTVGVSPALMPQIPHYLLSNPSSSASISAFWNQLTQSRKDPAKTAAAQDMVKIILGAIPDRYFSRPSLTKIEIRFGKADIQPIGDAIVSAIYQHKDEFLHDINVVEAGNAQQPFTSLDSGTESDTILNFNHAIQSSPVTISETTFDFSKAMFGGMMTSSVQTGVNVSPDKTGGVGAQINFSETAKTGGTESITLPQTTPQNSMTFQDFLGKLGS